MTQPASNIPSPAAELASEPGGHSSDPSQARKVPSRSRLFRWLPAAGLVLGLAVGLAIAGFLLPRTYVSWASLWQTERLRLPGGAFFQEDDQTLLGNRSALLKSPALEHRARARLPLDLQNTLPRDSISIKVEVIPIARSGVIRVEARAPGTNCSRVFLNALLSEYLEYERNVRQVVSGETLASISAQTLRLETEIKEAQKTLEAFQQSNNLAVLREERAVAGSDLMRLKAQLTDCQFEKEALQEALRAGQASTGGEARASLIEILRPPSPGTAAHEASSRRIETLAQLELLKIEREKLAKVHPPKDPALEKLDEDTARATALLALYHTQMLSYGADALRVIDLRLATLKSAMTEWQSRLADADSRFAQAERLQSNVARTQALYERLADLMQNVSLSRNIDISTWSILDRASETSRSWRGEITVVALSGAGGLALGLGTLLATAGWRWRRSRRQEKRNLQAWAEAHPGLVDRLRRARELCRRGLITREARDHKTAQILADL